MTLNIEPRTPVTVRTQEYSDRLFLIERVFGLNVRITLIELAKWSRSVEWNIPLELGELASIPALVYPPAPADVALDAIRSILVPGGDVNVLLGALESEGCRFVSGANGVVIHVADGTILGARHSLESLYSVASNIYYVSKNHQIGSLMLAARSSGGGAQQSNYMRHPVQPAPEAAPITYVSTELQLIALADRLADEYRGKRAVVTLNEICKVMQTEAIRRKHEELLTTNQGWASKTWLLANGLKGWTDPAVRSKK